MFSPTLTGRVASTAQVVQPPAKAGTQVITVGAGAGARTNASTAAPVAMSGTPAGATGGTASAPSATVPAAGVAANGTAQPTPFTARSAQGGNRVAPSAIRAASNSEVIPFVIGLGFIVVAIAVLANTKKV